MGSQLCCGARGAVGGSVPCSRTPQSWYWGWRESAVHSLLPPTIPAARDSNSQTFDYESDSLTIRPRLPLSLAIIHKWRKLGTVVNLPRSGRPTKITSRAQWRLILEVIKEPITTSKELQASLDSIKVSVHDSTIKKRLCKCGIHGRVPRLKPLLTKKNTKAHLIFT